MFSFRTALALCAAIFAAGCSKDPEVAKREYLNSGDRYVSEQKYAEAMVEYRNAIKQDPRFGIARYKLADTYIRLNMLVDAHREYIRAADLMPDQKDVQVKAGQMLLASGQFLDAQTRADAVLAQDPGYIDAHLLKATALAKMTHFDEAIKQVESTLTQEPLRPASHLDLGALQLLKGNLEAAEAAFKRAIESDPTSITARLATANFFLLVGRADEAEGVLKQAVALEPRSQQVNRTLAVLYLVSGRPAAAEQPMKTVLEVSNDDAARIALAEYYLIMRRRSDAQPLLDTVSKGKGNSAALATVRLAALAAGDGRRADAYRLIDEALRVQPTHMTALLTKAELLLRDGKSDQALAVAKAAQSADASAAVAALTVGRIHAARLEFSDAVAAFNEARRLDPRLMEVQLELARVYLASEDSAAAVDAAQAAVQMRPRSPEAQRVLADALLAKGDVVRAEEPVRRFVSSAPASAEAQAQLGKLHLLKRNPAEAKVAFEQALKADPSHIGALSGLTALDLAARRNPSARERIERRLASEPRNPALLMLAARTYGTIGDLPATERALRDAIAIDSSNLLAYRMLGQLYSSQQRLDEARHEFEEVARRLPKAVGPPTLIGMLFQMQNQTEQARAWYEKALAIDSKAPVAANNLAWLMAETGGNLDLALQLAQTAKAQLPDRPEVDDTLGWIYYKKGLATLAITAFEGSIQKDAKNATYHYHLGLAHIKNGDREKARRALDQVLALNPSFEGLSAAQKALASL